MSGDFFARYGLTVDAANVLGVRRVILEEAEALQAAVRQFKRDHGAGMPLLGGDPVSRDAARGFTEVTNQLLARGQAYIDELTRLGEELGSAARAYGHSERAISGSFRVDPQARASGLSQVQHLPPALRAVTAPAPARSWQDLVRGTS